MEDLASIQPLQARRNTKILTHAQKAVCMPNSQINKRIHLQKKNNIKRISFYHQSKELKRSYSPDLLIIFTEYINVNDSPKPQNETPANICIKMTMPYIPDQNDIAKRSKTLSMT
ncbi:hypothetical protein ElyMa_003643600 [Elysia marginata]|uniref:Uncharacterized protein n=1 Tax=Elysia marginata TaxID=1093978 RepID=A0AAV4EWK5_9GAST|nr:hypothetical protein ElyMa_003643600 [Elysia marginata]